MNQMKCKGIIVKQINFKDYDRIFTIITEEFGKIEALASMVRRHKSSLNSSCQLLYYSSFNLVSGKGELYQIKSADIIESFYPLRNDLNKVSYASYFGELLSTLSVPADPNKGALSLFLNTLHKITYSDYPLKLSRIILELRLLSVSGYAPYINSCSNCEKNNDFSYFNLVSGGVICNDCYKPNSNPNILYISKTALKTMDYIIEAPDNKLFSFLIPEEVQNELINLLERFIEIHLEKKFKTLNFLKTIIS